MSETNAHTEQALSHGGCALRLARSIAPAPMTLMQTQARVVIRVKACASFHLYETRPNVECKSSGFFRAGSAIRIIRVQGRSMMNRKFFRWLAGVVVVAALVATFWFATRPPPLTVQGEVSSDRVDVSSRVAARVEKLNVDVGATVKRGDVLAVLDSPQLVSARLAARQHWRSRAPIWRGSTPSGRRPWQQKRRKLMQPRRT